MARKKWWKYRIAFELGISPTEVEQWDTEDVLEMMAAISIKEQSRKGGGA